MEEFYYYWSMWFLWVLTTFILEKNRFRFYASAFILLNIILSMYQVRLFMYFNAAYLSFYIGAFMLCGFLRLHKSVKRQERVVYVLFTYHGHRLDADGDYSNVWIRHAWCGDRHYHLVCHHDSSF